LLLQGPSNIVHVRYADLWQYNPGADGKLRHRHFMATAWAAVWPVFLAVAAQQHHSIAGKSCLQGHKAALHHDK
jgi:hypothetical protein